MTSRAHTGPAAPPGTSHGRRPAVLPAVWPAVCGVLAALLQLDFLLELVLPGGPPVARSQISELSAPGQPGAWLFRLLDVLSGLLVLALVPGWWRASRTVATCLAVWGLGLALSAVSSASCADSLHPRCDGNGLPGPHTSLRDNLHDVGSTLSALALLLGIAVAAAALRRHGEVRRGAWVGALTLLAVLLGLEETVEDLVGTSSGRGISQRLQVVVLSAVLLLLADPRHWPGAGRRPLSPRSSRSPSGS